MTKKINATEIYNLVNQYLRTPANAYILTDENKVTTTEYTTFPGEFDYPGISTPLASVGTVHYPVNVVAGSNVTKDNLLYQLRRWALLYSTVRYCKFKQQTSGGAAVTVQPYYKFCSFAHFPADHLAALNIPEIPIDLDELSANSGIEQNAVVNTEQQIKDALSYMLPTLQQYWTDPEHGHTFQFCHSSCHSSCHGSRNRR